MKKNDSVKLFALLALTLIVYIPAFKIMVDKWSAADTYYSHGFLVPFISLFIVWLKRSELLSLKVKPLGSGWLFFIPAIIVYIFSALWEINFLAGFSLIPVLIGIILIALGKEQLKALMFPILFLMFMIPLPAIVIANLSFRLKIFAAQVSTAIINRLGVPAIREGSIIRTMHSQLMVEDPCSGIRSLIALIALGALMAYFSRMPRIKKTILFLSSIPIAAASNVIRIISLALVSEIYGSQYASGWFHDTMGILVFVFAFVGLALVGKVLE